MNPPPYRDAWRGVQLTPPQDWRVLYPPIEGFALEAPDGSAFLEFSFGSPGEDPMQAIRTRLTRFRQHEARALDASSVVFRHSDGHGQIRSRGGLTVLAQARGNADIDLTALLSQVLASITTIAPTPRSPWQEPTEHSFGLLCPDGWQVKSAIVPNQFGNRQPICRIFAGPDSLAAVEPEFHTFSHASSAPAAPDDSFWGKAGRWMSQAVSAMNPYPAIPFDGLRPVLEQFFLPRWQQQTPGTQLLGFTDWGNPKDAEATLQLPDGCVRVVRLQGAALPGSPQWVAGVVNFYQAQPAALAELEPVFRGLIASVKFSPQWKANEDSLQAQRHQMQLQSQQQNMQLQQSLHNQRMHDIQMQGQHNSAMHQMRQETADLSVQGFHDRSAVQDSMHHQNINTINERADYVNTHDGKLYNLPAGHERVWSDSTGQLFAGDWSIQPPPDWHELKPLR